MLVTDITKQTITIEGKTYSYEELVQLQKDNPCSFLDFKIDVLNFLDEWFDGTEEMTIYTSGSTGKPKTLIVRKQQMINSAVMTCRFLGLDSGDKCLLCMPLNYIAGKMIIIRALVAGLDIYPVAPSGHPLRDLDIRFKFAAMVPLQIFDSMQKPLECERLRKIGNLLIGGGALDKRLESKLEDFPNPVYVSYGMAETLSHIAMRRINGKLASLDYTPLPSVSISLSEEWTLVVDAPLLNDKRLITNDIAQINSDGTFRILGRKDNIINTGGIKIQIETLEALIGNFIFTPFAITSLPDIKYGEMIVLVTEQPIEASLLTQNLTPYQIPKLIFQLGTIPRTESGKINRAELKKIVSKMSNL